MFEFEIGKLFFEELEYAGIDDADLKIQMELDKRETMMVCTYTILGELETICDRCMDPLSLKLNTTYQLIFKFGLEDSEDENLIVLHPDAYEVDMKDHIYELIIVSLPSKVVHPKGDCNEEMMSTMEKYTVNLHDEEEIDDEDDDDDEDDESVWSILKNLN